MWASVRYDTYVILISRILDLELVTTQVTRCVALIQGYPLFFYLKIGVLFLPNISASATINK